MNEAEGGIITNSIDTTSNTSGSFSTLSTQWAPIGHPVPFALRLSDPIALPKSTVAFTNPVSLLSSFTLSFWAQPAAAHQIDKPSLTGTAGSIGQKYVVGPCSAVAGGESCVAISVGSNGVSIYQYEGLGAIFSPLLVLPASLADWVFITVTVGNNRPSISINGSTFTPGLQASSALRLNLETLGSAAYGSFEGLLSRLSVFNSTLTEAQTMQYFSAIYPIPRIGLFAPLYLTMTWAETHPPSCLATP